MSDLVVIGCRCLVGVVFAISAAGKCRNRAAFDAFVQALRLLAPWLRGRHRAVALGVIAVEATIPLLLTNSATVLPGALLASMALVGFTGAIVAALHRGRTVTCRCFGSSSLPLGRRHLVRNGLLCAAAACVAVGAATGGEATPADPAGALLALGAGATAAVFVARLDELVELFLPARGLRTPPRGSR